MQVGVNHTLQTEHRVADTAMPDMVLVLESYWDIHFNLVLHAKALLVHYVRSNAGRSLGIDYGAENDFVFRKRLLGIQPKRQIQFSSWPVRILTEAPHVLDHHIDLLGGECLGKRWHNLREAPRRPAMDDHVFPGRVRLSRGLIASAE